MNEQFTSKLLLPMLFFVGFATQARAMSYFSPDYGDEPKAQCERSVIFPESSSADQSPNAQLERLNKAINKFTDSAMLFEKRARLYDDMKRYNDALADINTAIELHSEREGYYWSRAEVELHLKNYAAALQDCAFAKKVAAGSLGWTSDWLRAQIYKAMGRSDDSIAAARDALNSIVNYGVSQDNRYPYNEVKKLLAGQPFKPEKRTTGKQHILDTLARLSQLEKLPSNPQLLNVLGLSADDVKNSFSDSNLYIVKATTSPWLRIRLADSALVLDLDSDVCSISEVDLKTQLRATEKQDSEGISSTGGPEKSLYLTNNHCRVAFTIQPGGYHSLSRVEFMWYQ